MLTSEQIQQNKDTFTSILRSIKREGANIEGMIYKLEHSDFFDAPASVQYHCSFKGGLCQHSLNVRNALFQFVLSSYPEGSPWSDDTLNIVSLCHDLAKMNFYEPYLKNVKVYCENGSKRDNMGKFEWTSEEAFKMRDASERFMLGSHGQNSEYIAGTFIPLAFEESVAIVNHMGWEPTANMDLTGIYNKHALAVMLHLADMYSTYVLEKMY